MTRQKFVVTIDTPDGCELTGMEVEDLLAADPSIEDACAYEADQ